jgi:hypothetical protein
VIHALAVDLDAGSLQATAESIARVLDKPAADVLAVLQGSSPSARKATRVPGAINRVRVHAHDDSTPGPLPITREFKCGHKVADENVVRRANGTKTCRVCHRAAVRRYEAKRVRVRDHARESRERRAKAREAGA